MSLSLRKMIENSGFLGAQRRKIPNFHPVFEGLFRASASRVSAWVNRIWLAGLYVLGIFHWTYFLNGGNVPFDLHDWTQTGPYYYFLRQAILHGQLPLHISSTLIPTDRYIARPDTLLSPQALLLYFLQPGPFMLANVLVMFTAGFLGLLLIRKRYGLYPLAFSALFLLYNFNGHITAHLAVGHSEWVGYFLLPFFVYLVLQAVEQEGKAGWRWVLLVALTLFFIFLQGAFHFFLWCLIFLLGLGLFFPKYLPLALKAILASVLLSLVRVLPPAVEYLQGGPAFISGFISVTDLVSALVVLIHPAQALSGPFNSLAGWEVDTYIGLIGLAFLLVFGVYLVWRKSRPQAVLFGPVCLLVFFSIGKVYLPVASLPLPLVDSERVPSRFLILPLVVISVLAAIQLQKFLDERGPAGWRERLLSLALLFLLGHDLFQHSRIWRVTNMYLLFPKTPVDIRAAVSNHPDPVYYSALVAGLVGSALTLAFLFYRARREQRAIIKR